MFTYLLLSLLPIVWSLSSLLSFYTNYNRVRDLAIPKVLTPICPSNVLWVISQSILLPVLQRLPFGIGRWTKYSRWGWEYTDRYRTHLELGDIWMQVTPANNWIYVADPEAISEIFTRRQDFRRPLQLYSMLDIFGSNVATVDGLRWQQHRKITGSTFNEYNYAFTWSEGLVQSRDMLNWWMSHGSAGLKSTAKDTRAMSLNILAYVGYKKHYPFDGAHKLSETGHAASFRDALSIVLDNALLTLVMPPMLLRMLPKKWARVGYAISALKTHMTELYKDETQSVSHAKTPGTATLMSSMVAASQEANQNQELVLPELTQLPRHREGLTVSEIFGNIFVYYFAGHDTTAAVFAYAMLLLAANPECQDWVAEELQDVMEGEDSTTWSYEACFPKMKRCLAILYETVRLYNPINGLPKWTGETDRELSYQGRILTIPARTMVLPSLIAVHTHPRHWGEDSLVWRPSRWIIPGPNSESSDLHTRLTQETLYVPPKGTYFPWSDGQRNCPGKKFTQVEFAAVIASLFRDHRVRPIMNPGETHMEAKKRILEVIEDSTLRLLLQMRDPGRLSLAWERR